MRRSTAPFFPIWYDTNMQRFQGLIFDGLVFLANFFFVRFFEPSATPAFIQSPRFAWFTVVAVVVYCLGAYIKRAPLWERLGREKKTVSIGTSFGFLLFLQWLLLNFFFFVNFQNLSGGSTTTEQPLLVLAFIILALVPVAFTSRALRPYFPKPNFPNWRIHPFTEMCANFCIVIFVMASTPVWSLYAGSMAGYGQDNMIIGVIFLLLTTLPFALFYLAPRLLLLAEDYRQPRTWLQIFIAMSPLAWRVVFG